MDKEKLEKLRDRERSLIKQLESSNRLLDEHRNIANEQEQRNVQLQQEYDIADNSSSKLSKLESHKDQLTSALKEKETLILHLEEDQAKSISALQEEVRLLMEISNGNPNNSVENDSLNTVLELNEVWKEELLIKQKNIEDSQESVVQYLQLIKLAEKKLEQICEQVKLAEAKRREAAENLLNMEQKIAEVSELQHLQQHNVPEQQPQSLFEEAKDSRVELKKKLVHWTAKYKEMASLVTNVENQIVLLKQQQRDIKQMLSTYPSQSKIEYDCLVKTYRDTLTSMKNRIIEYDILLAEKEKFVRDGYPEDFCRWYENFIKEKDKTRSKLKSIADAEYFINKEIFSENHDLQVKLVQYKREMEWLRNKIVVLQDTILAKEHAALENEELETNESVVIEDEPQAYIAKRVQFAGDVVDSAPRRRLGGRPVTQCKAYHFPTKKK